MGAGVGFILHRVGVPVAGTMLIAAAAAVALALSLWAIVMVTGRRLVSPTALGLTLR